MGSLRPIERRSDNFINAHAQPRTDSPPPRRFVYYPSSLLSLRMIARDDRVDEALDDGAHHGAAAPSATK